MPTVDAAAASAREPLDWEAMHREQQRHITASMAEDFNPPPASTRRPRRPSPQRAQPKRSPKLRARLERLQQTVGLDADEPPTADRCGWSLMPTTDRK